MKPDDIPQGVWDDAMTTWNAANAASVGSAKRAVQIVARAIMAEREACVGVGRSSVMKFRSKVGGRYYPGYHEDMRDAVATAIRSRP